MMLDLPAFGEVLADWLGKQDHWRPNVQKFSLNLLDDLKPRSYTRDLEWGIPVPLDGWRDRPDKSHLRVVRRRGRLPVRVHPVGAVDG